jgi:hypothetical protein
MWLIRSGGAGQLPVGEKAAGCFALPLPLWSSKMFMEAVYGGLLAAALLRAAQPGRGEGERPGQDRHLRDPGIQLPGYMCEEAR